MNMNVNVRTLIGITEDCWAQYFSECEACKLLAEDEQLHVLLAALCKLICDLASGTKTRGMVFTAQDMKEFVKALKGSPFKVFALQTW